MLLGCDTASLGVWFLMCQDDCGLIFTVEVSKMRPLRCLTTLRTKCPVMQLHIPEEWILLCSADSRCHVSVSSQDFTFCVAYKQHTCN